MRRFSKIIIYFLIITIIIGGIFLYISLNQENITFVLLGSEEVDIYEDEFYKELGFIAKDENDNDISNRVIIEGKVNNQVVGSYVIKYSIKTKFKTIVLERTINVLNDPLKNIEFILNGNKVVNIALGEEFVDPLYTCIDTKLNRDLSSFVKVESTMNNQVVGTYEIKYTIKIDNREKTLTRTVNVLESKYSVVLSNTKLTNQDVTISFISNISNFSYMITPDNNTIYESTYDYSVNRNGNYKFIVYDKENNYEEYSIPVTNIDKEAPVITSCSSVINNNSTTFTINTKSNDILKYLVNNNEINMINYTINQVIENGTLIAYDKANNSTTFNCSFYYKEFSPKGNENIISNVSTNTLKVWIEQKNRNGRTGFYTTHIWAFDPYKQFQVAVPNNFGNEVQTAKEILDATVSKNNWQDKLVVAVNASGFTVNNLYGQRYYDANKNWNYTSFAPIVIVNGQILRDLSSSNIPSNPYTMYGLNKNGILVYYNYESGSYSKNNIQISTKVREYGVLNTFSFSPVLVYDFAKKSTDNSQNIRQGLCQIDKNNFIFVTDIYSSPRTGFSFSELADYMISLGCKIGFNLDGGGSTSLIIKNKNSISSTITGSTRDIADIILFHE